MMMTTTRTTTTTTTTMLPTIKMMILIAWLLVTFSADTQGLPPVDMPGLVGETLLLPCQVDTNKCGNLHNIKWYRGSSRIYVFSEMASITRAEGEYVDRAELFYTPNSTTSHLEVKQLKVADEAVYKCEITYIEVREGCNVVQFINLTALIKPEYVRVTLDDETLLENGAMIGPYTEGHEITLTCESGGGKPIPSVYWWNETQKMPGEYTAEMGANSVGTGRNKIRLRLGRGDLTSTYVCKAMNDALTEAITSSVQIDVNVRPLKMELSGLEGHAVQGTIVLLQCLVTGARPAANVTWYNGTEIIPEEQITNKITPQADGTFDTLSRLEFTASRYENGGNLECKGSNAVIQELGMSPIRRSIDLEVRYAPIVVVNPENITVNESTSIVLNCVYEANPATLKSVKWLRDGQEVDLNSSRIVGGNLDAVSIRIRNATRHDRGAYTCRLENDVGPADSTNEVYVDIYYKPEVKLTMDPASPVSEIDRLNITLKCEVVHGNPDVLLAVRWYLNGELLKELPECASGQNATSESYLCDIDPSKLLLEEVGKSFHGNYSCEGMNEAGWGPMSKDEDLTVYYPPGPASLFYEPSRVVKKGSVTLSCSVEDPGRPETSTYRWTRGSHLIQDVSTANWTIESVTLETESNFTCLAYNEGGDGEPATVYIDVMAPPKFIEKLPQYTGALHTSQDVHLSCRVECSPICSIHWLKNGKLINTNAGSLYNIHNVILPSDSSTSDFESIHSTLKWNMTAWPGGRLDRIHDNASYTCESSDNPVGNRVRGSTFLGVEYPPENITVSKGIVEVVESNVPEKVVCNAKGYPSVVYQWRREGNSEILSKTNALVLNYDIPRRDNGYYVCEAINRHGNISARTYINVLYKPECSITKTEIDNKHVLTCTAMANPKIVDFTWRIKGENDTLENNIEKKVGKSFLTLDSRDENFRTYFCYANNSVGVSIPCELDVTGHDNWWGGKLENENMMLIIAAVIVIIVMVIIICIIIILVCRRKRAQDKYPSPSATKDKPNGAGVDGLGNADQDKAFYENLPFHGIQDAPNKCALHGGSQLSLHADASSGYGSTRSQPTRVGPLVTHQEEHFLSLRTTPRRPRQAIPLHFRQFQTLKIEANARGPMVVATVTTTLKTPPPPKKPQINEKPNRASPPPLPTPNHLQIPPVAAPRKSTPPSKSKHTYQNIPISPNNTQENGKTPSDHKPYRPEYSDLDYADVDYRSYGPINYKQASVLAAEQRRQEFLEDDQLL